MTVITGTTAVTTPDESPGTTRRCGAEEAVAPRSYYREVGQRLGHDRGALVCAAVLALVIIAVCAAPLLTAHDPLTGGVEDRLLPIGSPGHLLGTDEQGRDMLARLLYGGRLSLLVGIVPVAIAAVAGTVIGVLAAYVRGAVGAVLMRIMDVSYAFPSILLAIAVAAALGTGATSVITALTVVLIPPISRVAESATRAVMSQEYMEAARISGASTALVIREQVLPNVFSPIFIYSSSMVGLTILGAAGLSFVGMGVAPPPEPEWGAMLNGLRSSMYVQPAVVVLPGLMIFVVSLAFNALSDKLRDALDVRNS